MVDENDDDDSEQHDDDDDDSEREHIDGWDDERETPEIPTTWDEWWDFDWENYDGEYEEFAVSADYEG